MSVSYTQDEYFEMLMAYAKANRDPLSAARRYAQENPNAARQPGPKVFQNLIKRLKTHGNIMPIKTTGLLERPVEFYPAELVKLVITQFRTEPTISTKIVAARLEIKQPETVYRIAKDNGFQPYKLRKVQLLMGERDFLARRVYCETFLANLRVMPSLLEYILWTDECLFTLNGMWNAKNYVTWSDTENPLAFRETNTQYKWSLMVWTGMIYGKMVGPVFIEGSVDGDTYLRFVQQELPNILNGLQLPVQVRNNIILMHDGAPAHWDVRVRAYLDQAYQNRWIGRGGPLPWPPRFPDGNPLDYFLWGHVKSIVYRNDVRDKDLTKHLIIDTMKEIPADMLVRAVKDHTRRLTLCLQQNGGHFEHLR